VDHGEQPLSHFGVETGLSSQTSTKEEEWYLQLHSSMLPDRDGFLAMVYTDVKLAVRWK
jgi:hypothetical protein